MKFIIEVLIYEIININKIFENKEFEGVNKNLKKKKTFNTKFK